MRIHQLSFFTVFSLICCQVHAQVAAPLGLRQGAPLSSLTVKGKIADTLYEISVPAPNAEFEGYSAKVTPETGLCKLSATGKDHDRDSYGQEIRAVFSRFKGMLSEKYGSSKDFDYLKSGSIWDEPRDWVMAISKKERSLVSFWDKEEGSNLPDGLHSISLEVNAVSGESSYIRLSYEFDNVDKCFQASRKKESNSL